MDRQTDMASLFCKIHVWMDRQRDMASLFCNIHVWMDRQTNMASLFCFNFRLHIAPLVSLISADETWREGEGAGEGGVYVENDFCLSRLYYYYYY
jgi:hypothetical protein